ncbi:MAG: hypothetical protein PHR30_15980 [Gallionellaceae bacterium]|nr:hypothetical protein [Gallionellaceae bacterium]MDD5366836.1 hypothetical protein [Gallionellaceae bacterium]
MRRGQARLLMLLALFAAPLLAAWLAYAYVPPVRTGNYGELLTPTGLVLPPLAGPAGQVMPWAALRGKWLMLVVAPEGCQGACTQTLYLARQARLAQGREQARIERVLIGGRAGMVWPDQQGAYVVVLAALPPALARGGLFLVDPQGNLMLRFPDDPDAGGVIRDLRHLLSASGAG